MLNTIAGLPLHPLLVHLTVVAVPVTAVLAIIFVASRRYRAQVATVTFWLTVVSVISTIVSKSAGEAMLPSLGFSEADPGPVAKHADLATYLLISVLVMFVGAFIAYANENARMMSMLKVEALQNLAVKLRSVGLVITIIGAIASLILVFLTGHEGAVLTWKVLS